MLVKFKPFKVNALPSVLEADALYFVVNGAENALYVTDASGIPVRFSKGNLSKADFGLSEVENYSAANMPLSNAAQAAFAQPALTVTGTSYTLAAADKGKILRFTNASSITVNVPTGLGANFRCQVQQRGTGIVILNKLAGVTLNSANAALKTRGRYTSLSILNDDLTPLNSYIISSEIVAGVAPTVLNNIAAAPFAAFGLRKLDINYTGPAIIASNGANDIEIAFNSNLNLDTAAAAAHGQNLIVRQLFDQTGRGRHLVAPAGAEPTLLLSGARPMLKFGTAGFGNRRLRATEPFDFSAPKLFSVQKSYDVSLRQGFIDFGRNEFVVVYEETAMKLFKDSLAVFPVPVNNRLHQQTTRFQLGNEQVFRDGIELAAVGNPHVGDSPKLNGFIMLGNDYAGTASFVGEIGELIIFDGDVSASDQQTIEKNQMDYFVL